MRLYFFIGIIGLIGYSCNNDAYMVETTGDSDFSGYKTYAFLPETGDDVVFDDDIVTFRSIRIIQGELNKRGFLPDTANPDMVISVRAMFSDYHDDDDFTGDDRTYPEPRVNPGLDLFFNGEIRGPYTLADDLREIEYVPGTIVVDIYERSSHQLLWSAWFDQAVSPTSSPEELQFYFNRLFEKFPVDE